MLEVGIMVTDTKSYEQYEILTADISEALDHQGQMGYSTQPCNDFIIPIPAMPLNGHLFIKHSTWRMLFGMTLRTFFCFLLFVPCCSVPPPLHCSKYKAYFCACSKALY